MEVQERVTSAEFTDWIAFQTIEPAGWDMDNYRMARICETVHNSIVKTIPVPKGGARPRMRAVKDFLPVIEGQGSGMTDLTPRQQAYIRKKHGKRRHGKC